MGMDARPNILGEVTHYPPRTAVVYDTILIDKSTRFAHTWQALADKAGVEVAENQAFGVSNKEGATVYFMFTDEGVTFIGHTLVKESW